MAEELEQLQEENIEPTQEQDIQGEQVEQTEQTDQTTPQPPSKASQLYNSLLKDGYTKENLFGSEDNFKKIVTTKDGASKLYASLKSEGYNDDNLLGGESNFVNALVPQPPVQKYPTLESFGIDNKNFYKPSASDATYVAKQVTGEKIEQGEKYQKNLAEAIDNTTKRALDKKGIKTPSLTTYNAQKKKVEEAVKNGDAVYSVDPITKTPALSQTLNPIESLWNSVMSASKAEDDANDFADMTPKQRVEFVNKKAQLTPEGYIGEVPSGVVSKITSTVGGAVPFMLKMGAGAAAGATAIALAPETAGASLAGLPLAMSLAFTTPDMVKQGGMQEVLKRFDMLKKQRPNESEEILMEEAGKGYIAGAAVGGLTNLAFGAVGQAAAKPLQQEVKSVLGGILKENIKGTAKSAATLGTVTGAGELVKGVERGIENKQLRQSASKNIGDAVDGFVEGATTGTILHVATAVATGSLKVPGLIKSGIKYALSKENPVELATILKANEDAGKIPEGTTQTVMSDLIDYNDALSKTSQDLSPEAQASVAGLIQKRENLVSQMAQLDPTQVESYNQQVESINEQIKNITNTGNPFDYEFNQVGQKLSEAGAQEQNVEEKVYEYKGKQYKVSGNSVTTIEGNLVPIDIIDKITTEGKEVEVPVPTEEIKTKENDTENIPGLPSKIGGGQEPIQAQPIEGGGTQAISGGGVLQENVPSRQSEMGKETQGEVERLRTEEQAELDSKIPNAEQYRVDGKVDRKKIEEKRQDLIRIIDFEKSEPDALDKINAKYDAELKAFDEVYGKYDKLITPLLKENEPIQPTGEKVSGAVQPTSEVPEGQKIKEGVQPSTEPISGRGAEATTPVLEKGEKVKQNKDTQSEFTTSNGRQKVNRVGDELVVTDAKTGEKVSRKTHNKAVREYIDNFDFTHGEEGESTTQSEDVNKILSEVVENSNNPQQIAQIYAENDLPFVETAMTKDGMIAEYGLGDITLESYRRYGDINKLTRGIRANYFAKKGGVSTTIDSIAKEMSEHYFPEGDGTEITPNDIVDFMENYDTRKKLDEKFAPKNPLLDLAKEKFKKLTGVELTREVADKAFTQKIEKETQAEQNLLKQDYENAKQLEDEYWKQYEATDGFTKEAGAVEVNKGKEGVTEEGAKVEVPLAENPFENIPKTQVARDKYFQSTFGENAAKAEEIYNKYKDTNDFEAMQKEMQGEKLAEQPPVPPIVEKPKSEMPSEEEKWTAIRKEKLEEIKGVKEMFEKQTSKSWTKIQQEALEDVAKEFPKKTLSDAIRTKVERLAAKYDAKEDYNPTAKDLAVIQEFKRQTESRITAAKEELLSDNDVERFAAIAEMESYQNDLMNASKAFFVQEAGRAFGFRQSESMKDENAGLQIRRMQLIKANGMEKLSEADNKFLESQWEKEKELMKREQELREQSLKEGFDKEVAKLQEEYEAKLKEKKISATDKKASDKLRKFAEKVRNSKTLDSLGLGAPIEGEAKGITFNSKEALAKVIDKMADGMDKIEAITKVLKEYGVEKSKEFSDLVDKALIKIAKPDTEETLSKIKDLAEKTGEKNVTNEMVAKGLVRDYVNSFIGEVDKSNVLNEAATKLKEVLPDLDKKTLRNAFLKEGEFKQPTKKSLNESLNQAKRDLLKIEKEQSKKEATEDELQKKKLEQEKEKAQKSIKDYQKKLDNGEFEKEEPVVLKKQDAELIQINKEKNQIKSEFDKKRKELEEKNKHWLQRAADFARSTYIAALIGSPVTLAKVAYMSAVRPASEITRKVVLGNLFKAIAPSYYEAALRGGESASLKNIEAGLGAYFRQMGEKKMQEKFQKSSNEFDQAAKKYYDAVNAKADEKTLSKLKQDMDNKRLAAMGNIVYQFIGGSSIKDALQSLINRANEVERQFGKTETESIKDGNALDKLNYILGFIGRSHSAAKTFSGRFSYAASFMARLEGAARDGSISDPNRIIEIAHESYLDWERGKYQQDNWVTKKWNDVVKSIKEKTVGKGEWSKYDKALEAILKTDVAITRVPVNIIHEAVTEYTLGALRAPIMAYKEYNKAKGKAAEEGYSKTIDSKEFKGRVKEIISQMDAEQAAKIYRLFTKGGLGAGLYGLALATGLLQFGVFPHKGQKKKKEEEYLKEGELNPGQVMFGKDRLGETASKLIEHTPSLWTTFMGLGIAKIYADDVKEGKMSPQAAWDAAYTHMQIVESSIPQTKVVSPLGIIKQAGKSFAGKLSDYGMLDNYIDSKGAFINQEKKKLEMTTSEVARLKEYKVEPPRLGVRSQNKIEVDAKHPKVGLSKDGKPYAYMNDFEWDKFNQYRKDYISNALKEIYDAADGGDIKLTQENLTDALTRITKQATTIAKNKLIEEGLLPEKNKEDEEDENVESINSIIKDIYKEAKE